MGQTTLEKSQGEFNKIRNDEVVKGISVARDLYDSHVKQVMKKKQDSYKVTMQEEPVDTKVLTNEIKGDLENAERPEAGQVPKTEHHVVQPNNSILELLEEYPIISVLQDYANNKGREIEYDNNRTQQPKEQELYAAKTVEKQDKNYVVRSSSNNEVQTEER